jgi:hypothetical protein
MRKTVGSLLLSSAAAACLAAPPASAEIGNCHSFTYWQLTGVEQLDVNFATLEGKLKQMLYRPYELSSDVRLEPGDVVTFGDAHSGFSYGSGTFANLRKTMRQRVLWDGSLIADAAHTLPIRTSALWTYPDDYIRDLEKNGASRDAIRAKMRADPPSIGFFSTSETIESLIRRIPSYAAMRVVIWKQPERLRLYPEETRIELGETVSFQVYLIYPGRPELVDAKRVTRLIWLPGFARGGVVNGREAGVGRHEITVSSDAIAKPWGLESELIRDSYRGQLFHRFQVGSTLEVVDSEPNETASTGGNRCQLVLGAWRWFNGAEVTFGQGTAASDRGDTGSWTCLDPGAGEIQVSWNGGVWIDTLTLSADATSLSGTNQLDRPVGASR